MKLYFTVTRNFCAEVVLDEEEIKELTKRFFKDNLDIRDCTIQQLQNYIKKMELDDNSRIDYFELDEEKVEVEDFEFDEKDDELIKCFIDKIIEENNNKPFENQLNLFNE